MNVYKFYANQKACEIVNLIIFIIDLILLNQIKINFDKKNIVNFFVIKLFKNKIINFDKYTRFAIVVNKH